MTIAIVLIKGAVLFRFDWTKLSIFCLRICNYCEKICKKIIKQLKIRKIRNVKTALFMPLKA